MPDPRTAVLFPGQGSQTPEMRADVERVRPDLIAKAANAVGDDPFKRAEESTRYQQPAIFCAALAGWEHVREQDPGVVAGHSLGELTALVAAGALDEADGLRLVATRGRLMAGAAEANGGGMMAVRASRDEVEGPISGTGAHVANDNAPRQVVLAGSEAALDAAARALETEGVRSRRLAVRGAFHSPAMRPAVDRFRAEVKAVKLREPGVPVVSCVTARPGGDARAALVDALTSPIRWVETLHALHDLGARRFVESGPGAVLTGLVRRTLGDVEALAPRDLEAVGG
jgi:[acyl-carrier-protein] S-malonyltransferase